MAEGKTTIVILLTLLQQLYRIVAPILVPIALLFTIKTKERNKTWAPHLENEFPSVMRRLPSWLKFMETPDDQLIPSGLYEPTVLKIYKKYGWFISQWYWLGFRNVGHGLFYKLGFDVTGWPEERIELLKKKKEFGPFEIRYGHKILTDWYLVYGGSLYAMPRFTIRLRNKK